MVLIQLSAEKRVISFWSSVKPVSCTVIKSNLTPYTDTSLENDVSELSLVETPSTARQIVGELTLTFVFSFYGWCD
jgi:hypothetical protein